MLAKEKFEIFPTSSPLLKPARLLIFTNISYLLAYYILLANFIFPACLLLEGDARHRYLRSSFFANYLFLIYLAPLVLTQAKLSYRLNPPAQ